MCEECIGASDALDEETLARQLYEEAYDIERVSQEALRQGDPTNARRMSELAKIAMSEAHKHNPLLK